MSAQSSKLKLLARKQRQHLTCRLRMENRSDSRLQRRSKDSGMLMIGAKARSVERVLLLQGLAIKSLHGMFRTIGAVGTTLAGNRDELSIRDVYDTLFRLHNGNKVKRIQNVSNKWH